MTPKQVNDIFNKLPSKRRKVLVGFLAGHSREKIMIDADIPSDAALTGHLKELYKNFRIDTAWNDADDRRSGARKLPLLISLFARYMPELISDRIPEVLDAVEQEEAIAKPSQELVESKAGSGEILMSFATSILEQIGFNQKFQVNRTSQYTGYRLKKPGERAKSYLLVLTQYKEGLCISISRDILNPYVLELKFYDDVWVRNEYDYDEADCEEFNHLYWVIPSKEDIFLGISQDYKDIFSGESTGSFYLDPKGIDTDDVIHKHLQGFKLKRSKSPGFDWHFDHGDLIARLDQSDCCISMNNIDRLFPNTRKAYINSREILEEFIHYFGEIFMDNY